MPTSLSDALNDATIDLALAGSASPKNDAEILLAHILELDRNELKRRLVLGSHFLDEVAVARYADLITARSAGTPLQHLTGIAHFRHLDLQVGPGVFIPRPETEIVAEAAIAEVKRVDQTIRSAPKSAALTEMTWQIQMPIGPPTARTRRINRWVLQPATQSKRPVVVDLCTGSGAIALAIASETNAQVHAIELDDSAYEWAALNIGRCLAGHNVLLRRGDALQPPADLIGKADVVVANPPYIPPDAIPRDVEVRDFDPAVALYGGGAAGLETPAGIILSAATLLKSGGLLVLEHGDLQGAAIRQLAAGAGEFTDIQTNKDLTGRDRYLIARRV